MSETVLALETGCQALPATEAIGNLEAHSPVRTAVSEPHERVGGERDGWREPGAQDPEQLEGIVGAFDERATPVDHADDAPLGAERHAHAQARRRSVPQVLIGRIAHERVADIAQDEKALKLLVELEAEAPVGLARAEAFLDVTGGDLELQEGRETGEPPGIGTWIVVGVVAELQHRVAQPVLRLALAD